MLKDLHHFKISVTLQFLSSVPKYCGKTKSRNTVFCCLLHWHFSQVIWAVSSFFIPSFFFFSSLIPVLTLSRGVSGRDHKLQCLWGWGRSIQERGGPQVTVDQRPHPSTGAADTQFWQIMAIWKREPIAAKSSLFFSFFKRNSKSGCFKCDFFFIFLKCWLTR